jgi:glucose-6-phosphate dehydrogenase assembly protein OpcA
MSVRLDDTTAAQVSMAIAQERFHQGSSAVGRVLTLVIIADEATQADAVRAAAEAAREHPSRILVAIPRPGRGPARLDAEIMVGGSDGLGELAELRLRGPLAHHVASVVLPLLVPDAPVVAWWPAAAPDVPADDPIGRLAQRRITDASASARPHKALEVRRQGYHAGDTDLSWTRITPWRALLASTLDQPTAPITGASVSAQRSNPSSALLAAWLQRALGVPVDMHVSRGPGITGVSIRTEQGDISITRPDGRVARMLRPGFPEREAALHRRTTEGLIAEELRRLDPDEIYGETLDALSGLPGFVIDAPGAHATFRHPQDEATGSAGTDGTDASDGSPDASADRAAHEELAQQRADGAAGRLPEGAPPRPGTRAAHSSRRSTAPGAASAPTNKAAPGDVAPSKKASTRKAAPGEAPQAPRRTRGAGR